METIVQILIFLSVIFIIYCISNRIIYGKLLTDKEWYDKVLIARNNGYRLNTVNSSIITFYSLPFITDLSFGFNPFYKYYICRIGIIPR